MSIPFKFNSLGISGKFRKPLKLTATQDSSSVKLTKAGNPNVSGLKYRVNSSNWQSYLIDTLIELNEGDYVEFMNTNSTISTSSSDYVQFVMTGKIAASGNIQSLLNYIKNVPLYSFYSLFKGCSSLTSAPELPATTLATSCYKSMFSSCSSLAEAPELPATTLADYCYQYMFASCSSLTEAPELPAILLKTACYSYMFSVCRSLTTMHNLVATTLAPYCYEGMFNVCTSLVTASELPATTLATSCYKSMFSSCSSLAEAPELPATTLADNCYQNMFYRCTSLRSAPNLPALTLANNCYYSMFEGCTGLIVGPTMNATTLATNSCVTMFSGCSLLQSITVKFSDWGDSSATNNWLLNVASTGTFTKPGGLAETRGPSNIPTGWSIANSYKRDLAYIESTGTQYINTGVKPNFPNNDEIYISFYGAEYSGSSPAIFGSRQSDLRNGVYALGGNVTVLDADGYTSHAFDLVGNRWVKMDNLKVTSNGRNYEYTLTRHPNCTYSIYLFALNNGGNTYGIYNGMKIYEWKYYQNGELKQWLIPVMNNDDIPCMYDLVNGTFKYNAGTGQFNYGEL